MRRNLIIVRHTCSCKKENVRIVGEEVVITLFNFLFQSINTHKHKKNRITRCELKILKEKFYNINTF